MTATPTSSKESPPGTINVQIPVDTPNQLSSLASATSRKKSFLTTEAPSSSLETQNQQVNEIEAGIIDADKGDFATDEQVNSIFTKYGA